ncbi:MAG: hypothetical protein GVY18_00715 [Bacteroidetes bacterium]|jgi:hypothetical protein|nr:hypothetical protein [Bacteroidota bacterium]
MIGRISPYGAGVIIAGVLLLAGLLDLPSYRFYQLQRLVVCGVAVWGALLMLKGGSLGWAVVLGVVAFLFNPLFPYAATHLVDVLFFRTMGLLLWLEDATGWHGMSRWFDLAERAYLWLIQRGFLALAATLALWASARARPAGDASDADTATSHASEGS